MPSSGSDFLKYLTAEIVRTLDTPREQRRKKAKEPLSTRWFGMIPMALKMMFKK